MDSRHCASHMCLCLCRRFYLINTYMIKWLVETFLKKHIDELVDSRIKEQMFERYYAEKANDLHERIQKLRRSIGTQAHRVPEGNTKFVQSSSVLEVSGSSESELLSTPSEAKIEKQQRAAELDDLRAKLLGKKK